VCVPGDSLLSQNLPKATMIQHKALHKKQAQSEESSENHAWTVENVA
jgi:hypothetical protein